MAEHAVGFMEGWFGTNSKDVADRFRPFVKGLYGKPREMAHTWEYYLRVVCNDTENNDLYDLYEKWERDIMEYCRETGTGFEYATSSGVGIIE